MADVPTIVETGNNNPYGYGFGGAPMGAGFIGGLVLGSLWNGNGFGGNRGGAVADVTLSNSLEHVSDQINQGTISQLQSSAQVQGAIAGSSMATQQGINAVNITSLQNTQQIAQQLCGINQNITSQGYESRLQGQALAAQLASQHADISRQIFEENCKDRELQREIQTQALRDKLAETQANNAALNAQINLSNQLTAQTAYLLSRLDTSSTGTTTTTTGS